MSRTGFSADVSVGKGAFELVSGLEPYPWLDFSSGLKPCLLADIRESDASVALSTFQPSRGDPTEGYWDSIIKRESRPRLRVPRRV
jgi:hypothetical protein